VALGAARQLTRQAEPLERLVGMMQARGRCSRHLHRRLHGLLFVLLAMMRRILLLLLLLLRILLLLLLLQWLPAHTGSVGVTRGRGGPLLLMVRVPVVLDKVRVGHRLGLR
jgi:hypothetical protein